MTVERASGGCVCVCVCKTPFLSLKQDRKRIAAAADGELPKTPGTPSFHPFAPPLNLSHPERAYIRSRSSNSTTFAFPLPPSRRPATTTLSLRRCRNRHFSTPPPPPPPIAYSPTALVVLYPGIPSKHIARFPFSRWNGK